MMITMMFMMMMLMRLRQGDNALHPSTVSYRTLLCLIFSGRIATRVCTQWERIQHVKKKCDQLRASINQKYLGYPLKVLSDELHRLLYCYMSKVGCTALKMHIVKANAEVLGLENLVPPDDLGMRIHGGGVVDQFQLLPLQTMTEQERHARWMTYFRLTAARHPFDRLISAWRDKVVNINQSEFQKWPREILQHNRPELFENTTSALAESEHPEQILGAPRFDEFLQWIYDKRKANVHWDTSVESCHVCATDWDAILRIETMSADEGILKERLNGDLPIEKAEDLAVIHSMQDESELSKLHLAKELPLWRNISQPVVEYFLQKYSIDMEIFGYQWDSDTRVATCSIDTPNGRCC